MDATLVFGNGINRLSPRSISWDAMLQTIKGSRPFDNGSLPNTMIYERIILEAPAKYKEILNDEYETKIEIAKIMERVELNPLYMRLLAINFKNYITTNYDIAFLYSNIAGGKLSRPVNDQGSETVYSIRRAKRMLTTFQEVKMLWQIHGEIKKPATLMLGLDHYCGAVGRIDQYVKGGYRYHERGVDYTEKSITQKLQEGTLTGSSWIESFFLTDIYILGLGLDYSEIDLWWILNKRARLKRSKEHGARIVNRIFYYCITIDKQLEGVLRAMSVEIAKVDIPHGAKQYDDFYEDVVGRLERSVGTT